MKNFLVTLLEWSDEDNQHVKTWVEVEAQHEVHAMSIAESKNNGSRAVYATTKFVVVDRIDNVVRYGGEISLSSAVL